MAIIGLPMLNSMFGSAGSAVMATVMPFGVLMYNISAVIILSIYAPADKKMSGKELKSHIFKTIVKNPLILSILAAFLIVMIKVELPECVNKGLSLLGDTTLPLAMIALGAGFKFSSIKGKAKYSLTVTAIKIIILPILMIAVTLALGYRGVNLGVIIAVFGGPVAVASYIMASNMGSDKEIAAQILIFTTLGSMFTLFIQIFLLKSLGVL
jgi:predicted permease